MNRYAHSCLLVLALVMGCDAASVHEPNVAAAPPQEGELGVLLESQQLQAGAQTLYFSVAPARSNGTAILMAGGLTGIQVRFHAASDGLADTASDEAVEATAEFVADGPVLKLEGGATRQANYRVELKLPPSSGGLLEFIILESNGSEVTIPVPVRIGEP